MCGSEDKADGEPLGAAGPGEPEVAGLLALIRHRPYRRPVRPPGRLVLLRHHDRSRWDRGDISAAIGCYATSATISGDSDSAKRARARAAGWRTAVDLQRGLPVGQASASGCRPVLSGVPVRRNAPSLPRRLDALERQVEQER
ncbi:DUF6596 domain-containing protein [Micromonospora purpureochromogenes]|uniref:DUF6596 domain-containing protein n=1 Tax=Micromonospora purpureochromogenes TaxID=47872 RepID=UPI00331BD5F9